MLEWVEDREHLRRAQQEHADFLVLAFWGEFSEAARRALPELEEFSEQEDGVPVFVVDVQKVPGVHKEFGVEKVPTVLAIEDGEVTRSVEGVQSARFYAVHFSGASRARVAAGQEAPRRRVVVYSGPGCPACGALKAYLRRNGVSFREVDISRDQRAAEKIARRSGRMAVPQTDINGRLVVGFNRAELDRLLGIQSEREE
ncbi:MAG: thioredoxin family protein [Candidatus Brocadiia bacterium]